MALNPQSIVNTKVVSTAMSNPTDPLVKFLALDPGNTTGWAQFDAKGNCVAYGQFTLLEQVKALDRLITSDLDLVICENYVNYGWKQQKRWSENQTSKNIGKIELMCEMREVEITLVPAAPNKGMGYMYMGMTPPSNHDISHQFDAMAHGVYELQMRGIRPVGKALLDDTSG